MGSRHLSTQTAKRWVALVVLWGLSELPTWSRFFSRNLSYATSPIFLGGALPPVAFLLALLRTLLGGTLLFAGDLYWDRVFPKGPSRSLRAVAWLALLGFALAPSFQSAWTYLDRWWIYRPMSPRLVFALTAWPFLLTPWVLLKPEVWRNRLERSGRYGLPLLAVAIGHSALGVFFPPPVLPPISRGTPPNSPTPLHRVVIVIFDEWDQKIGFEATSHPQSLPNLSRLRNSAWSAASAFPPAGQTLQSIPSMITGLYVKQLSLTRGKLEIQANSVKSEPVPLADQPHLFRRAWEAGAKVGLSGWVFPYPILFGGEAQEAYWVPFSEAAWNANALREPSPWNLFWTETGYWFGHHPWPSLRGEHPIHGELHLSAFRALNEHSQDLARQGNLDLVFLHYPIPHLPGVFNPATRTLGFRPYDASSYEGNLMLLDRTIGELDASITRSSRPSHVIYTSDHWFRGRPTALGRDHRVPFIIRLAGEQSSGLIEVPFNTRILPDLSMALLQGQIRTASDLKSWLNRQPREAESPLTLHIP